jgi:ADP-heptose:LPS heptosyltransferase
MFSVRAPDHFGDGVMALPAIEALACVAPVRVHAPAWGRELYGDVPGVDVLGREAPPAPSSVGVLLKPSFGAAWRWRHLPRRVGLPTFGRRLLLTEVVEELPGEHRRIAWARVARSLGGEPAPQPRYRRAAGSGSTDATRVVAVHAWGRTPRTRWPGMRACADALAASGVPVVFLAGPGEAVPVRGLAGPHRVIDHAPLEALAALLSGCAGVLSHDSGLAHFADACGVPVVMVHGPTDPAETGVGVPVIGRPWPSQSAVLEAVRAHLPGCAPR